MRIAITGGGGFIGGHAARHFARLGHRVHAFGRRATAPCAALPGVTYHRWDLAAGPHPSPPAVDAVVHCAAAVADWGPFEDFHRVNVRGTRHVLETFGAAPRFVQISSASVYDLRRDQELLREDAPYPPDAAYPSAYGRTKALAERLLLSSGRPVVILRPRAVYGAGDTTLLPRILATRRGGRLIVAGPATNRLSITAVENLLVAIERGLAYNGPCRVFNVADQVTPRLGDLLRDLLRALGRPPRLAHIPAPLARGAAALCERLWTLTGRAGEPRLTRYAVAQLTRTCTLDLTRAREALGYRPVTDYRTALPALAESLRAAPGGNYPASG